MTKNIKILRITPLQGPNIWTYRPVIEVLLDIGELEDYPSNLIPGLYERLTECLPSLIEHRCGVGERGGFLERLREGTWAGHILEHVVLELQNLAGMRTGFGKTRQTPERGIYKMAFRTRHPDVGRAALAAGRELLLAAINNQPYDLQATVDQLRELVDDLCLGPSTAHIVDAAIDRKIPFIRLTAGNLVQLGYGAFQRRIWTAETDKTSAIAEGIASDKDLTKSLLKSCGVPVPEGCLVDSPEDAWEAAQDIGLPVVVKPYDGNHGRGVSLDLNTREDIIAAYHLANRKGGGVMVEQFIQGNEHRLLVVGKRVIAAARGETASVIGDGKSTIIELVNSQINSDPRRGEGEEFPLNIISLETGCAEVELELQRLNLTPQSIPAAGQSVLIQRNGNVAFDVTDQMHPSVAAMAALAARVVGLDIAGVDLVVGDISRPLEEQRGAIIEVNASPGLLAHIKPASGQAQPVGAAIVDYLFEPNSTGRMPIVGVTGSQNTALISRLIAWIIQSSGRHVGLACSSGLFLDNQQVEKNSAINWSVGQRLLMNRVVESAVFESNARMILSEGLVYDKCNVGVVADCLGHEGLDEFYIHTAEQLPHVIRTQVDVVLPEGTAVLNAAHPDVLALAEYCDGEVIVYGQDATLPGVIAHRSKGGRAVFVRDKQLILASSEGENVLLETAKLKPALKEQVDAVLAAVAAAWALAITPQLMTAALHTFDPTIGNR